MTLREYLDKNGGPLSYHEALRIFLPVLSELSALHRGGKIHGAVSPDSIRVSGGSASLLCNNDPQPCYAPPADSGGAPLDPQADIYSAAACLYTAVTGIEPPAAAQRSPQDPLRHVPADNLPLSAERAILKGMSLSRAKRYRSALEFRYALMDYTCKSAWKTRTPDERQPYPAQAGLAIPHIFQSQEDEEENPLAETLRDNKISIAVLAVLLLLIAWFFTHIPQAGEPDSPALAPAASFFPSLGEPAPSLADTPSAPPEPAAQAESSVPPAKNYVSDYPFMMITTLETIPCRYTGGWADGKPQGQGTAVVNEARSVRIRSDYRIYWSVGDSFTGTWDKGFLSGTATETCANGDAYQGTFSNNEHSGQGVYQWNNGESYSGGWNHNLFSGYGVFEYIDGSRYEGNWKSGMRSGHGKLIRADGTAMEGQWDNNHFTG